MRPVFAIGLLVFVVTGCHAYDDLELFELLAIAPAALEPGATLRLEGEGFPVGRSPELTLTGTVHRPGTVSERISMELDGEVQTESLITVPVDASLIRSLGGRATFDGAIRLAFRASDDRRDLFATHPVVVDFLPDTSTELRAHADRGELRADLDADHFGVVLSREESGHAGVVVESVRSGSLAQRQGVRRGDRVLSVDGLRLYSWRDFVADPSRTESVVLVSRPGLPAADALRWPHPATEPRAQALAAIVLVLLGLLLGWLSPIALCVSERPSSAVSVWFVRISVLLVFAALVFSVPAVQLVTAWIAILAALAVVFAATHRGSDASLSFAFVVLSTLTIMMLDRTSTLGAIVGAQRESPLAWHAVAGPASTMAFVAYLYGLHYLTDCGRVSACLYSGAASVLGAVLFFGGWSTLDPMIGIVTTAAKSTAIFVAAHFVSIRRPVAIGALACGLLLATVQTVLALDPLAPYWGPLAAGCAAALVLRAAWVYVRSRLPLRGGRSLPARADQIRVRAV